MICIKNCWFLFFTLGSSCVAKSQDEKTNAVLPGAYQIAEYFPNLQNKKVAVTVNHSSLIGQTHLTDTLFDLGIDILKVFTPEHGFTGTISDGVEIDYEGGKKNYELISLYGKNKKPTREQLDNIDIMVLDIQDVGVRFYTYISTMHYVMEACAEKNIPMIIMDRPNPNAGYVDGPILDTAFRSFVGLHPIPVVHGLTMGELAQMINGERWLKNGIQCEVNVVKIKNWNHQTTYALPVKPSPNLPNDLSIALYPSLCLFEGTIMSVGRGTDDAFQHIGHPEYPDTIYAFTPVSREGAKWPLYENKKCYGISWIGSQPDYRFSLRPLISVYKKMKKSIFFNKYFTRLIGNDLLQKQIQSGMTEEEIRKTWKAELERYQSTRLKYLLYE